MVTMQVSTWLFLFPSEVKMKVAQSCPTLCDPVDYRVHGIPHTNQNNWPKETLKKCPIEVIQTTTRV